ncbi:type I polyketide synthase [Paludifilum halophilum]|uniref:Polyketide synthase subunit n=1 Tax=Paludifilum halophilum TaxID=1642702 RepID=A0A235B9U8_9BACL|nr:type I polyketide synthase [Paludifilum halophilum]OYD09083.1 polyketide synthase subunit [Paludifilum halophilum]
MTDKKGKRTGLEIAVIGLDGRFPGARDVETFWRNLQNGVESITHFTDEELAAAGVEQELIDHPDYVKAKGIIDDYDHFDASFFGYTRREAEVMDPQIRLFHECVWGALEDAGYVPDTHPDPIGLFAGASSNIYWQAMTMLARSDNASEQFAALQLTDKDFMNSRTSYKLNLKGPSVTVETACSTSLSAVHAACRALLTGDCKVAVAGGVTVTVPNKKGYLYQEGMILSPDGRCRAFDAEAQGTVGGEGCGVVVLKPLKQALADRDHIYAVIKGSAYNNDGTRKIGYTAPSIEGEAEVVRSALRMSRVEPESISYVETHGTGTSLGDPVEIEALKLAFQTDKRQYCGIGSVKTNIGHLDAAAGIAGLIKTVLALKHKQLPPSLHFKQPNPKIDFAESPFYVNNSLKKWEHSSDPLRAGVSSFGIGGTNVHVILEEAPEPERSSPARESLLFPFSAQTETALEQVTDRMRLFLQERPETNLADLAFTLQTGRKHFKHRRMFVASTAEEVWDHLSSSVSDFPESASAEGSPPTVTLMFPGQGSQYVNMGRDLYEREPDFREEMDRCFAIVKPLIGVDLSEVLYPEQADGEAAERIKQTAVAQPLLFIFEYALAKLLMKWGIPVERMIGHSIGEYVAACLAGVFTLEDALALVALRGKYMQSMPEGAMLSVPMREEELAAELSEGLELAAVNSSQLCVVSGTKAEINALAQRLEAKGISVGKLHTSHAFHSRMMDPILKDFQDAVSRVRLNPPRIPYISNLSGTWIRPEEATDPAYWAKQLRQTVRFAKGLDRLCSEEHAVFLEAGPGNALSMFVRKHEAHRKEQTVLNLVRHPREQERDSRYLLQRVGRLWLTGVEIDWKSLHDRERRNRLSLPTYPFERQPYGMETVPLDRMKAEVASRTVASSSVNGRKKADPDGWFYVPSWERTEWPRPDVQNRFRYLLLLDEHGRGEELQHRLEQSGHQVVTARIGTDFALSGNRSYVLNPVNDDHFRQLLESLREKGGLPDRVIHLWGMGEDRRMDPDTLDPLLERGYSSMLSLARACGDFPDHPIRLTVVTDRMQEVTGEERLNPVMATVLGACRVIPQEYGHIRCTSLDLAWPEPGNGQQDRLIQRLLAELQTETAEEVIAYRGQRRWVHTVKPVAPGRAKPGERPLRQEGVYLITGGLGGMGLTLAEYLAKEVRAQPVLIGRTAFPARHEWSAYLQERGDDDPVSQKIQQLMAIEQHGVRPLILSADVSDEEQMKAAVAQAVDHFGAIHGVIHAAGVPDGAVIQRRSGELEKSVLSSKVKGTLVLERVLEGIRLDFFVLYSSLVSVLGAIGQVGYVASNTFLDAYAHYRCANGWGHTVSINWDRWREVGMAAASEKELASALLTDDPSRIQEETERSLSPSQGVEVFERALQGDQAQVMVSTHDLAERLQVQTPTGLLDTDPEKRDETIEPAPGETDMEKGDLEQSLAAIWKDYFGMDHVGVHDNFFEMGATSLDLLQLNAKIKKALNREVPTVMMFTHPTIHSLAQALLPKETGQQEGVQKQERSEIIDEGKNRRKQRLRRRG